MKPVLHLSSSGASIIVNFGTTPVETAFGRVEAEGFLITGTS